MEEIQPGELVRVNMAIKRLERKNFKPLSSCLNKILCKPLKTKTNFFPPPPHQASDKTIQRSQSNSNLRGSKKKLTYAISQNNLNTPVLNIEPFELKNPLISPGTDKKKTFNEMKALISPALRNNLPKLNKPDLNVLNEKNHDEDNNNNSFFSQNSGNLALKTLLKPVESDSKRGSFSNKKNNFFFPDEAKLADDQHSKDKSRNYSYDAGIEENKMKNFEYKSLHQSKKNISFINSNSNTPKNKTYKVQVKILSSLNNIYQTPNPNNTTKNQQREREVSDHIAQNIKKLNSLPLITRKETVLKTQKSNNNSEMNSFSVDFQPSFYKNISKNNDSSNMHSEDLLCLSHLYKKKTLNLGETKVLSSRYDFHDQYLAVGCEDSLIRIYNQYENHKLELFLKDPNNLGIATTSIRWRPKTLDKFLLAVQATGIVTLWNVDNQEIITSKEEDNYIYTCDFNSEGLLYATGGSDTTIRVYDLETKMPIYLLKTKEDNPGHSNRVYNAMFNQSDPNILFSGGWDCNIFIWDLRTGGSVNYLSGPMICGDSMDLRNHELLTGSWRNDHQIEIWDIRTLKLMMNVPWINESINDKSFIYSCKFSKASENFIIAGSTGKCELRLFDKRNNYQNTDSDKNYEYGIFSLDFSQFKDEFVAGTGEGKIIYYQIRHK